MKTAEVISGLLKGQDIEYELLFVNDGSSDKTWEEIQKAREKNESVRGISFSRNFGKEAAILKSRHFIPRFDHVGASTPMSL
jgi:dolichol-phosphate mannosyltransferase